MNVDKIFLLVSVILNVESSLFVSVWGFVFLNVRLVKLLTGICFAVNSKVAVKRAIRGVHLKENAHKNEGESCFHCPEVTLVQD